VRTTSHSHRYCLALVLGLHLPLHERLPCFLAAWQQVLALRLISVQYRRGLLVAPGPYTLRSALFWQATGAAGDTSDPVARITGEGTGRESHSPDGRSDEYGDVSAGVGGIYRGPQVGYAYERDGTGAGVVARDESDYAEHGYEYSRDLSKGCALAGKTAGADDAYGPAKT
jgi:hypothetical protein